MIRTLVTAGNTRERIDTVREWGNIFTGNTGLRIAEAMAELGDVDLLTSNAQHLKQLEHHARIRASGFRSHEELRGALAALMASRKYDAIFMTAAVADYRPTRVYAVIERSTDASGQERWVVQDVQAGKVKSTHDAIAVLGERTEKIVDLFRTEWKYSGLLVKFKLEVGITPQELIRIGQTSRKTSGADYLVANTLDMVEGNRAGAYLLSDAAEEWVPRAELPARLSRLLPPPQ